LSLRRALFLDRDGVINVDHGYVHRPNQIKFIPGIFELCQYAGDLGYLIFVVTNQAGIGRGYYTERDFWYLMDWMIAIFRSHGADIAKVYFCPYHSEHGIDSYKQHSSFRKPGPGMILQAADEFKIDLQTSVLVGDKVSDIKAGLAAGVGCNVLYSPSDATRSNIIHMATSIVESLAEVKSFLTRESIK
jgi:D-glycero-D-manno-heptose 1,7-bisphosphate phosphatase